MKTFILLFLTCSLLTACRQGSQKGCINDYRVFPQMIFSKEKAGITNGIFVTTGYHDADKPHLWNIKKKKIIKVKGMGQQVGDDNPPFFIASIASVRITVTNRLGAVFNIPRISDKDLRGVDWADQLLENVRIKLDSMPSKTEDIFP